MTLWHFEIKPARGESDVEAKRVLAEAAELHLPGSWSLATSRGFLLQADCEADEITRAGDSLLLDPVVETSRTHRLPLENALGQDGAQSVHVLRKPGVTDPVAESALELLKDQGYAVDRTRTVRSYQVRGPAEHLDLLIHRVLMNDAIEQVIVGPLRLSKLVDGTPYRFELITVPLRAMDDRALEETSRNGQLALSLEEIRAIQDHFRALDRDPTDCDLETIAQTWSEHCSHKTLRGMIEFEGTRIDNLLRETIFKVSRDYHDQDWLVSIFEDNAGVVGFDAEHDICFKVETHNHPSAIEPYGGANTGLGGVIRDPLGTGRSAKPIASIDVFCVASPHTPPEELPPGVLHPRRVLQGVVAGVRDYGNRMGIPTVAGAVCVDPGFLSNPLVFCGTIGVMPRGTATKHVEPGDLIVAIGGRTGRDGIHGATFSSLELSSRSDELSGGAVQIGNAITEKRVVDAVLRARNLNLIHSITDCGAGGFSSAIGELGATTGAEVDLERAPIKYEGLTYTEIWISEAQERMILSIAPEHYTAFEAICREEHVECTILGRFTASKRLHLRYHGHTVADLDMAFLHEGRPRPLRQASFKKPVPAPLAYPPRQSDLTRDLLGVLSHGDVESKEWIIRQYDHEVQGRTVLNPLVGVEEDGPGDAAVILPVRGSYRGLAVGCGLNVRWGSLDPESMAACAVDEAIRNVVCVGADPDRIALLDNFCWGNPERPETLGSLVLAARGASDAARAFRTPFISGKDSLYNEYEHDGVRLAIPTTLLVSAMGIVPNARLAVSMELKKPGHVLLLAGETSEELGGSVWCAVTGRTGGTAPRLDPARARANYLAIHAAIGERLVKSAHDCSDGGLAVALAEMAFAGGLGIDADLGTVPVAGNMEREAAVLFSESPARILLEVPTESVAEIEGLFESRGANRPVPIGRVTQRDRLIITGFEGKPVIDASLAALKTAWKGPRNASGFVDGS